MLGRVIPFVLVYVLLIKNQRLQAIAGVVLVLLLGVFALTQSVGGLFIGLPSAVVVVLLMLYKRKAFLPIAVLFILGVIAFVFLAQFPRFGGVLDFSTGTNFRRIRVWQSGIQVIKDYPLTGLGLDQFLYAFRSYYILPDAWQEPDLSHPHNFILDFWIRLGLLGLLSFTILQVGFWKVIQRFYTQLQVHSLTHKVIMIGCAAGMINLLAHGLVDNSVFVNDLSIIFALLLALPQQSNHIT
jgi:O-antigen ligase